MTPFDRLMRLGREAPYHSNYILNGAGEPVPEDDVIAAARWQTEHLQETIVARTEVSRDGQVVSTDTALRAPTPPAAYALVSTVFLGLNHAYFGGPPVLYETLVFVHVPHDSIFGRIPETSVDGSMRRYHTREEALAGHEQKVRQLQALLRAGVTLLDEATGETHWPEDADEEEGAP